LAAAGYESYLTMTMFDKMADRLANPSHVVSHNRWASIPVPGVYSRETAGDQIFGVTLSSFRSVRRGDD
jgi:hypothetical protein